MGAVRIRPLAPGDPEALHAAFAALGWDKPVALFERYRDDHVAETRYAVVAITDDEVAGYVTLVWASAYEPFAAHGIPEISDLNVLPQHRRRGIAAALLDHVEQVAARRSPVVGLGVGLYADYGAAQRIYARRGYLPDGRGVMYANEPVAPGSAVVLDDDATLMLTKRVGGATDAPV